MFYENNWGKLFEKLTKFWRMNEKILKTSKTISQKTLKKCRINFEKIREEFEKIFY